MMIKVGQIWQDTEDGWRCVITRYSPVDIYYIWTNGSLGHCSKTKQFLDGKSLIKEYPTWQEAVNSKEFKE